MAILRDLRVLPLGLLLMVVSLAHADALEGRYTLLAVGPNTTITIDGKRLKSCGSDGKDYLNANRSLVVKYSGKAVIVGDEEWILVSSDKGQVVAKRLAGKVASNVEIWFRVEKGFAQGMLIYSRKDSDDLAICATAQPFEGKHNR